MILQFSGYISMAANNRAAGVVSRTKLVGRGARIRSLYRQGDVKRPPLETADSEPEETTCKENECELAEIPAVRRAGRCDELDVDVSRATFS